MCDTLMSDYMAHTRYQFGSPAYTDTREQIYYLPRREEVSNILDRYCLYKLHSGLKAKQHTTGTKKKKKQEKKMT